MNARIIKIQSGDGTPIACRRSGSGPSLILVHGTTADHTRWSSVLPALEKHFTVFAVDRRGRGGSGDSKQYAIEQEFDDIAAVVNTVQEPVYLLGHSYGALCCLEAALLIENLSKLILYEPCISAGSNSYPHGVADRIQNLVDAGHRDEAVVTMFREIANMPDHELHSLRSLPSWKLRVTLAHTIARETRAEEEYTLIPERFAGLVIPVLLLLGGESPVFMKKATEVVHTILPNSQIAVMQGQQHIAMNTAPELFVSKIITFLLD